MRIAIVGDLDDLSAAYIGWLIGKRGGEVIGLSEERLGLEWSFEINAERTLIVVGGLECELASFDGAFVRLNPEPAVPEEFGLSPRLAPIYALERRHGLHWLLDEMPCAVVNRPSFGRSNGSKPLQMHLLALAGFDVPRWLAANDASLAAAFAASCPRGAVYKSCSGLRSHVRRVDERFIERLGERTAPVVVQEFVSGSDVRVHVVGEETFATEVLSESTDYRFDSGVSTYRSVVVPDTIARLCCEYAASEGLLLAGFDFRYGPDGWRCLEMNPVPTFLPYEAATGEPIGEAIGDLFDDRPTHTSRPSRLAEATTFAGTP
jgi:hypothetical protein